MHSDLVDLDPDCVEKFFLSRFSRFSMQNDSSIILHDFQGNSLESFFKGWLDF
tara:strand:+ start:656 stop:814 length:159 start_codon:yes stop_codon:yes gene_type:complete